MGKYGTGTDYYMFGIVMSLTLTAAQCCLIDISTEYPFLWTLLTFHIYFPICLFPYAFIWL